MLLSLFFRDQCLISLVLQRGEYSVVYMYSSLLGNWVLKLPWNVPKILYLYGNLRCKDVSWYAKMDMKSQVATFATFHLINFTFHKIPQILFYRNKMPEKTIQFILTRIFEVSFETGPLWLVWLFWQVRPKCPFQFDKTVVPSTALQYPADNYRVPQPMCSGLGWDCTTRM